MIMYSLLGACYVRQALGIYNLVYIVDVYTNKKILEISKKKLCRNMKYRIASKNDKGIMKSGIRVKYSADKLDSVVLCALTN